MAASDVTPLNLVQEGFAVAKRAGTSFGIKFSNSELISGETNSDQSSFSCPNTPKSPRVAPVSPSPRERSPHIASPPPPPVQPLTPLLQSGVTVTRLGLCAGSAPTVSWSMGSWPGAREGELRGHTQVLLLSNPPA